MSDKPTITDTKVVAKSRIFNVEEVGLRYANGQQRRYERLIDVRSDAGAVLIVPMLDADTVLLIREYGVGVEDYSLVLPRGLIEVDESLFDAANREMQEEVGYAANTFTEIKLLSTSPGYIATRMRTVLAEDIYVAKREGDEPEALEVVPWRLSELPALVARDDIHEARTIAVLYFVRDLLHGR